MSANNETEYLFKCKTNEAYVLKKILMELLHHTVKLAVFSNKPIWDIFKDDGFKSEITD